jgi:DNA-binding CsgD family transcriptional regulator
VTDRQLEILACAAQGRTNRQIGESLGISERTVRNHMREIFKRMSSTDRTHAVVLAIRNGWINVPIEPEGDRGDHVDVLARPTVARDSTSTVADPRPLRPRPAR